MMKIIGLILFFLGVFYLGNAIKIEYKNKYLFVAGIIDGLEYLKKELLFMSNYLSDALINSGKYAQMASFIFIKSGNLLKNNPSVEIGEYLYSEIKEKDENTAEIMRELGNQLGTADCENEVNTINNTISKLNFVMKEYETNYKVKGELIGKVSVILGICFCIILI